MSQSVKFLVTWILNAVIAVLCILSIVGYFFGPFWKIDLTYNLQADTLQKMIGSNISNINFSDIIDSDGVDIDLTLDIETTDLFHSFDPDINKTTELLVSNNVDKVVEQLASGPISEVTEKTVRSVAKSTVKDQVNSQVRDFLSSVNPDNASLSDENIQERLENANIPQSYLEEQADRLIDSVYEGNADVDQVCDEVVDIVDDVYERLQASDDEELKQAELTDSDREKIRDAVAKELDKLAGEGGSLNPEELLANLLNKAAAELGEASAERIVPLAAAPDAAKPAGSANEQLKDTLRTMINGYIPSEVATILVWVLRAGAILMMLSSIAWLYIIVKLVVKLATHAEPTVKLKAPILFGWLPFLILVAIPSIAVPLLLGPMSGMFGASATAMITAIKSVGFASIGWIALMGACICFAISIFYIVLRKMAKKEED